MIDHDHIKRLLAAEITREVDKPNTDLSRLSMLLESKLACCELELCCMKIDKMKGKAHMYHDLADKWDEEEEADAPADTEDTARRRRRR